MGWVLFLLALVIVPIALVAASGLAQKADEAWMAAAKRLNLNCTQGGLMKARKIEGMVDGFRVKVDTYTRRHGDSSTTYTRFRVKYRSLGLGLNLQQEGFFTGVTKLFGAQDIQVGDADFDQLLVIKGHSPKRVKQFLTSARRMRIQRYFAGHRGAEVKDHEILWSKTGVIRDADRLVLEIKAMLRLASHLKEAEDDDFLQQTLASQDDGRTDEALQWLQQHRTHADDEPAAPEENLLEGTLLYLGDRADEAKQRFEEAVAQTPDDTELQEWYQGLFPDDSQTGDPADSAARGDLATPSDPMDASDPMNASEPVDGSQSGEAVEPESAAKSGLDIADVCNQLFSAGLSSYQITHQFEQSYGGKTVTWNGTLKRVEPYSYDLVFGEGPGCRAVITIHKLPSTGYGDQHVSAIVQYPAESKDELRAMEGKSISFTGELCKVDGLMRNLFVKSVGDEA